MNIMMLSWEYPPLSYGGLARHVQDISEALAKQGHNIYIITQGKGDLANRENEKKGVQVIRTEPVLITPNSFVDHILQLNFQMVDKAMSLINQGVDIDIIHGHDWLAFWASKVLKHSLTKPLVYTIHATEYGRNHGIYNDMQRYINDLEWYACFEAWKVIVCSQYMSAEVKNLFQLPNDKVVEIANGVNPDNYQAEYSRVFKEKYTAPEENLIFYVGRIVREKGIQVLIQSLPEILSKEPQTKLVIAGKGPHLDNLKAQADFLGIANRIYFTGFISDQERNKLYQVADIAVFPSLYEPFGIVALEGMATKTPVVVSDVGGLAEIVEHGQNGFKVNPGDTHHLAETIVSVLQKKKQATQVAEKAYKMVLEEYTWDTIASKTIQVYQEILAEYEESTWNNENSKAYIKNERKEEDSLRYSYILDKKYS